MPPECGVERAPVGGRDEHAVIDALVRGVFSERMHDEVSQSAAAMRLVRLDLIIDGKRADECHSPCCRRETTGDCDLHAENRGRDPGLAAVSLG